MSLTWRGGPRGLLATVLLVFVIVCPYEAMGQCSGQWPAVCDSSNNNCRDYLARWDYVAGLVQFTVTATQSRNKWVAIAFSRDRTMGQTDVVMGFVSYSGGTVFDGWITERIATPTRDSDSQLIQPFINYADGTYTLSFLRTIPSSDPQDLALDQDLYFIFPVGGGTYSPSTGIIRQHSRTPSISSGTYNLAGCGSSGGNPTTAGTTAPPPTTTTPPPTTTTRTTTTSTTTTPPPTTTTRTTTTSTTTTQAPITTTTGSTTSTTTTASRVCENAWAREATGSDGECTSWAATGECLGNNQDWMLTNCWAACSYCAAGQTECHMMYSDAAQCLAWARNGDCGSVWMTNNCYGACATGCANSADSETTTTSTITTTTATTSATTTTVATVTSDPSMSDCVNIHDDDAECAQWASSGQCDSSAVWMMVNCRMACTDCSPEGTTPRTTEGCMNIHDDDGECAQWASSGQCDNSEWMMVNCRMACTDCTPEGTTPRTTEGCEDLHQPASECRDWAAIGQCRDNPDWMLENCQLSCTNCHITESCVNANGDDDQCVFWAFDGQCSSNPEFMLESCARACSACPATVITPNFYYGGSVSSELGPWTEIVCQGTRLDVTCPAGYVLHVNGGFFGRMDGLDLCMAQGQYVNMGQDCTDTQALQQLIRLCDYSPECSLYVDPTVFIDPCPNQQSYLNVSLSCQLAVFQQWSCEDTDMTLFCEEPNQAIHIEFANFGRTEGLLCPDPNADMSVRCESDAAWNVTTSMCNGRNSCHLFPSTDLFGDTCTGTRRYAHVAYTCGECVNEHEDEDECEGWADDGQCELNQEWMMARCRKSCTRCHLTDTCLDLDVSGSCAYWAYRGGCITNADYMLNNCAQTCNYCDDIYWPPPPTAAPTTWAPLVLPDNVRYEIACNYTNAILNCPEGTYVRVLDAFFGRRDPLKCTGGIPETTCDNYVADTFHIVRDLCNGRTNCTLWAGGEPPFTEPCHYTSKYLEVNFTCDACVNRHGDDAECQNWADFYNCDSNQYWMHSNCYKACSGCDTANTCENYLEDRLCDYYASWNQCTDNAAYMLYTCPKSCRSCWIYN